MALTNPQKRVVRGIMADRERRGLKTDPADVADPDVVRSWIQEARTELLAEQSQLASKAQARNAEINQIVTIIDGILAL